MDMGSVRPVGIDPATVQRIELVVQTVKGLLGL